MISHRKRDETTNNALHCMISSKASCFKCSAHEVPVQDVCDDISIYHPKITSEKGLQRLLRAFTGFELCSNRFRF